MTTASFDDRDLLGWVIPDNLTTPCQQHLLFPGQHHCFPGRFHTHLVIFKTFQGLENFYFEFQDFPSITINWIGEWLTQHERAQVVLQFLVTWLEAAVGVVSRQGLVHAGHKCSDRATLLGRVVVRVNSHHHQVLQLPTVYTTSHNQPVSGARHSHGWYHLTTMCSINKLMTPNCCHMGTAIKHLGPYPVKPSFVISDTRTVDTLTCRAECQSARMSKMTTKPSLAQDALLLDRYGNSGCQRVK